MVGGGFDLVVTVAQMMNKQTYDFWDITPIVGSLFGVAVGALWPTWSTIRRYPYTMSSFGGYTLWGCLGRCGEWACSCHSWNARKRLLRPSAVPAGLLARL